MDEKRKGLTVGVLVMEFTIVWWCLFTNRWLGLLSCYVRDTSLLLCSLLFRPLIISFWKGGTVVKQSNCLLLNCVLQTVTFVCSCFCFFFMYIFFSNQRASERIIAYEHWRWKQRGFKRAFIVNLVDFYGQRR